MVTTTNIYVDLIEKAKIKDVMIDPFWKTQRILQNIAKEMLKQDKEEQFGSHNDDYEYPEGKIVTQQNKNPLYKNIHRQTNTAYA